MQLICRLHAKNPTISAVIVGALAGHFRKSSEDGPWRHFVQALRALTALTKAGVLARESYVELVSSLLELLETAAPTATATTAARTVDFLLWSLCAALPLLGAELMTELFPGMAARLNGAYEQRRAAAKQPLPADLVALWACFAGSQAAVLAGGCSEDDGPPIAIKLALGEKSLQVDRNWDAHFEGLRPLPDAFAAEDAFLQWTVFLWCRILLESLELNHRRCADIMLSAIPPELGSGEKIVCAFLFGELLRTRQNDVPALVYETLMMDCCRLSKAFPPIMAKSLGAIYGKLDELGPLAADRLAAWFAHHLSNFDYKWNWTAWSDVLAAPPTSMQYIFVRFTLEKLVRLSYRDRVASTLPEPFRPLLPPESREHFKFAVAEGQMPDDEAETAMRVTQLIQGRAPVEEIKGALGEMVQDELDSMQREVLLQSLLKVGSKSLSHMLAVVERYLPLFHLLLPKSGTGGEGGADAVAAKLAANAFILDQVAAFWRDSVHNFEFAVERLINYRILLPRAVLLWLFQRADEQLSDVEHSFYDVLSHTLSHNLILRTLQQAQMMPSVAQAKLQDQQQPAERTAAVVAALEKDYEEALQLLLERLATLREQIVAAPETVALVDTLTCQLAHEIVTLYPQDAAKACLAVISQVGRKASSAMLAVLEQA